MRHALAIGLVSLVAAPGSSGGDRSPAIRVFVRAAGGGIRGAGDSAFDVQHILQQRKPDSVLAMAASRDVADVVPEVAQGGARRTVALKIP